MRYFQLPLKRVFNSGQPYPWTHPHIMKPNEIWPGIPHAEFKSRREKLLSLIPENEACVVLESSPVKYSSQNIFYRYHQNNNVLYFTGWNEPDSKIVLNKLKDGKSQFNLFLKSQDEESKLWEGERNGPVNAKKHFQADSFYDMGEFEDFKKSFNGKIYEENSVLKMIHTLRVNKSPAEIQLMSKAAQIAIQAFKKIKQTGFREESQLEALFEYECRTNGASGLSYVPVVAGGSRSLIIHYTRNDQLIKEEEELLMDAGCKFNGYCSDITRSFPPLENSKMVQWQKIYDAVYRVQSECIKALNFLGEKRSILNLNLLANHLFTNELDNLGFKKPDEIVYDLFPHSIGHYLGMDVHDCPTFPTNEVLTDGMVITVEPGLYIPHGHPNCPKEFWGIGIRIEDDVLIKKDGSLILSQN
jgi:Xaa-Pro aminopeptidase